VALLDDYIVASGAAVITATVIVLLVFLGRYRQLVTESTKSSQLAKNVYDSMNTRLSVMDARIIDLMAKVDVYSTRQGVKPPTVSRQPIVTRETMPQTSQSPVARQPVSQPSAAPGSLETERQILGLLVEGPKTSNQINAVVGKSREHMGRLLKGLFERGLVVRNDRNKPYVYEITEVGRSHLAGS
jgi:CRP-like cAMP-binding protein